MDSPVPNRVMISARVLMCAPTFFGVEYEINPWMRGNRDRVVRSRAQEQWQALHQLLVETLGLCVDLVPPQPGLPDLVFTANAGLVQGTVMVPSRFRHRERQREEPHYATWFTQAGWTLRPLPDAVRAFEGAGDALFDGADPARLWAAHGFRTDAEAHAPLSRLLDVEVVSLQLIDPRFYHLDTCFCPLPGGYLLWYPPAFAPSSRAEIERRMPRGRRLAASPADARGFACNAVVADAQTVVLPSCSRALVKALQTWGFSVHTTPLFEFLKAGGAAKCLTLGLG